MADEANAASAAPGALTADPATVFAALAEIIYQGSDATQMYAAICVAATLVVPGCDHASLLVKRDDRYVTVGASSRLAHRIDDLERRSGDGPCIDAIEEETPQVEPDLTKPNQWPHFAARLVEETPVRGAMGFRLLIDKRKAAALNLFSETPNKFDTEAAGRAAVLASFASVAINAIAHGEDATSLRRGLLSNREIGKAVGMLMMLHDMNEDDAFDLLRRHSQSLNIKLADVARRVIESRGNLPDYSDDGA
ncbi:MULTISPECIES: GAF and ANTAR domain-containing protein [Mycobacterium]|uniref:Antitermination regulator n=1 Tax=Mycobacterium gordonae TaxID=1778 RepID=A0A1A6BKF2_MYCGO|nr:MULTISPECIES: GAF and ANTAR domain-containing protein [Mycobacterium]MBI2700709.1 GAF and ANTAR domain-containing protein [Mycobacterium sp.]MCQ4360207.1 GAF and ANTAR domain-containing protein [Mycobacterium gordonae]MCV7005451.1 GAF and ANTAR domain-containing protein [Mycobacterium gordonae]OBS02813.1 antitermination regulator [Mycobacterium gordonae]ODR19055.1 antitermination regulator [Mycobacterium gordonae]